MTPAVSNNPVAVNGALSIIAAVLTPLLAKRGFDNDGIQSILTGIGSIATAALAVWGVFRARAQVTPLANPKNNAGQPLTPDTPPVPPAPAVG